jgi:hypothetical protein
LGSWGKLGLGLVTLAAARASQQLEQWERELEHVPGPAPIEGQNVTLHRIVGAFIELRPRFRPAKRSPQPGAPPPRRDLRERLRHGWNASTTKTRLDARLIPMRRRLLARVERWESLGRTEERHAQALARHALQSLFGQAMNHMAARPELQALIAEQSAGLTRSVVQDMRARSAEADTLAEELVRRIWKGWRQPRPSSGGAPAE